MQTNIDLQGFRVAVTGGTSGLGLALSRCWRLTATHSEIGDLRQQRSTPSIAETLGFEILSWCDGT